MKLLTVSVLAVEFPLVCRHVLKLKLARSLSGPDLLFLNSSSSMPVHFTAGEWQILTLFFFFKGCFHTAITHKIPKFFSSPRDVQIEVPHPGER